MFNKNKINNKHVQKEFIWELINDLKMLQEYIQNNEDKENEYYKQLMKKIDAEIQFLNKMGALIK